MEEICRDWSRAGSAMQMLAFPLFLHLEGKNGAMLMLLKLPDS
ncbi:hypothetical protein CAter282_1559 [Collimonas arenae]|uniref:Uncharacterized protein n=1 Tax=Collimonas arenae TaxID=279058 RepID=A0A127QHR2_9BURK|nr:hypothetical protein CAter10_1686 [Collimonas arenae]AMP09345.1 hypothetical protein CAter282_1559 [Collimonas arenae]